MGTHYSNTLEGASSILHSDAVRRIVVTSSVAAIDHPVDGAYVYTTVRVCVV